MSFSPTAQSHSLRPLLPNGNTAIQNPVPVPAPVYRRRAAVTTACEACRNRKSRCSGTRPKCDFCVKQSTECHYIASSEETHTQALKRKYRQLLCERDQTSLYRDLFELLRSLPAEAASSLVGRIQAGDPVHSLLHQAERTRLPTHQMLNAPSEYEELYHLLQALSESDAERVLHLVMSGSDVSTVIRSVQNADLLLQLSLKPECRRIYAFPYRNKWPEALRQQGSLYLQARLYDPQRPLAPNALSNQPIFDMPYSGAALAKPALGDLKVASWTNVLCHESRLQSLLSIYILHFYPFFHFFSLDLFLSDLQTGQTRFCSALLVNAVLAAASHYDPSVPGRNEPWNTQSLCYKFFSEAKRLWELESGGDKLTSLQAALVMNVVYNMDGLDDIGNVYMMSATKIAYNLDLFGPPKSDDSTDMARAQRFTAWGLFSWQATVCFHYHRRPLCQQPPATALPDPSDESHFYGEVYIRYTLSPTLQPIRIPLLVFHTAQFRLILNNIANKRFGRLDDSKLTIEEVLQYYQQLEQWFQSLHICLQPQNIALPCQLQLHMHFQHAVTLLLEAFVEYDLSDTSIANSKDVQSVAKIVQLSRLRFETITRIYHTRHSFGAYDPVMLQFLSALGFKSMDELGTSSPGSSEAADETLSSLLLAIQGLYHQSQSSYLSDTVFRLLYVKTSDEVAELAGAFINTISANTKRQMPANHIRASYPLNILSINADAEEHRLNSLLNT